MNILWLGPKEENSAVTIYPTYIILNKSASDCLNNAYRVLVGVDDSHHNLIIKAFNREEVVGSSDALKSQYQVISFTKSYGRITGKHLIDRIKDVFSLDFSGNNSYKFKANYDNGEKMLVVKMKEEV